MNSTTTFGGAEIHVEGGPVHLVFIAGIATILTIIIGIWITIVLYRTYQRTHHRPQLFLAGGIFLIAPVNTLFRILLSALDWSLPVTNSAAVTSQIIGLGLILYAIYGRPERGSRRFDSILVVVVGILLVMIASFLGLSETVDSDIAIAGMIASVASMGMIVAIQSFRGYLRHDSSPMLFLSVGIVLLTILPFGILVGSFVATDLLDIAFLLLEVTSEVLGLFAILYSLRWA